MGQEKPEYQRKQAKGKKFLTPAYQRHKPEQLQGVGMIVLSDKSPQEEVLGFNKQTLSRYNGRKRQFVDYSFARESTKLMNMGQV